MLPILIVEDEKLEAELVCSTLRNADYQVELADSLKEARAMLSEKKYSLALIDYQLPDGTGNELLSWSGCLEQKPVFLLMSAFGTVPRAVEAVKLGARDFLEKPLNQKQLMETVRELSREPQGGVRDIYQLPKTHHIIFAEGSPLEETLKLVSLVANKACSVFLYGESGTGKEIFAGLIHRLGTRADGPLVSLNCAAIPENLIESELFGYQKGAFTGALQNFRGRIEQADGGTLFLDEIGDMPVNIQSKLLRVLQEKTVTPIGAQKEIPVNFRLICATHKDIEKDVQNGLFREDLYYRINVVRINIPPLRDRPGDILRLVEYFLSGLIPKNELKNEMKLLPDFLLSHSWPGNIRELKNLVERYSVLRELGKTWNDVFAESGFEAEKRSGLVQENSGMTRTSATDRQKLTDQDILNALEKCGYHREKTAKLLGVSRRTLQYCLAKMKRQ